MATIGPNGMPHLVAMWYGLIDGKIYFETKGKCQKVAEPAARPADRGARSRPATATTSSAACRSRAPPTLIEDTDDDEYWAAGISLFERYQGEYSEEMRPFVEMMMNKRVAVRVEPTRVRSWDHRKLEQGEMPRRRLHRAVPLIGGAHLRRHRLGVRASGGPPASASSATATG